MDSNLNLIKAEFDHKADQLINNLLKLSPGNQNKQSLYHRLNRYFTKRLVLMTLQHENGVQANAAKTLGIGRHTFRKKMDECGITREMAKNNDHTHDLVNDGGVVSY